MSSNGSIPPANDLSTPIGTSVDKSKSKKSLIAETEKLEGFINSFLSGYEKMFSRLVSDPVKTARFARFVGFFRGFARGVFKFLYYLLNLNVYVRIGIGGITLFILILSLAINGRVEHELSQAEQALREHGVDYPAITRYCHTSGDDGIDILIIENEFRNGLNERMAQFPETYYRVQFKDGSKASLQELDYATGSDTNLDWKYTELGEQRVAENTKMILGK